MFSVIIPAYNAAAYIQNSINSVLSQTVGEFEIIVVNDGSEDETSSVVDSISDIRVKCIYQKNKGVAAARNTGIRNAKGDYICFLDADDLWKPNHLEVITSLIEKFPETSVYITGYEILLRNGQYIKKSGIRELKEIKCENVFKMIWEYGYFIHTNSIVCKANVFKKVGLFEEGIKNGEDDDMWYRLFAYFSVAFSNKITTTYIRENSRATIARVFVEDWIFLYRVTEIMNDRDVLEERKMYLHFLLEQRKISAVRHYILLGDKKTAWIKMKKVDRHLVKKKKYIETIVALLIPCVVLKFFVDNRDKRYYNG